MKFAPIVIAAALPGTSAFAGSSPTFTTFDHPSDPTFNQLLGINTDGVISGYYGSGVPWRPKQGYTIASPYTEFVPENLPGSIQRQVTGIAANRTTVGFWVPADVGITQSARSA